MHAVTVWLVLMNFGLNSSRQLIKVSVPTKVAALAINRARTQCDHIKTVIRHSWKLETKYDCMMKSVYQENDNVDVLFKNYHEFVPVSLPIN